MGVLSIKYQHYIEAFKLSVIRDYLSSDMSMNACAKKYRIGYRSSLHRWLRQYGYESKEAKRSREAKNLSKEDLLREIEQLKSRVAELEQALEAVRTKSAKQDS